MIPLKYALSSFKFNFYLTDVTSLFFSGGTSKDLWPKPQTLQLLDTYKKLKSIFSDGRTKKKKAWDELAAVMECEGYKVSGQICNKKFDNMKAIYKGIKDNARQTGRGGGKVWEYYVLMDEIMCQSHTVTCPNVLESSGSVRSSTSSESRSCDGAEEGAESGEESTFSSTTDNDNAASAQSSVTPTGSGKIRLPKRGMTSPMYFELEEKRMKVMSDMTAAIVASNRERTEAVKELTDTLKELIKKM